MPTKFAIYLRKSRQDLEAEAHGEGETLKRHETALLALAKRNHYCIGAVYREIVSGDTIAGRPEMQRLLSDVEAGRWKGVLVMEESRLARGDTMDQGRVQQAFYYSHTLIITPNKVYNPDSEADQEYFEFGLFMARREYKMINRRLIRGRYASAREGKWVGCYAPYGYKKVKLEHEKGHTLEIIPEKAEVVKSVFNSYLQDVPIYRIAKNLSDAGIITERGQLWTTQGIRQMIDNPTYCGMIRYGYRKVDKQAVNGSLIEHHYLSDCVQGKNLFAGRHQPIISVEMFHAAQMKRKQHKGTPGPNKEHPLLNPLAGLLYCSECGRAICRNPGKPGSRDRFLCLYPYCNNGTSLMERVETLLITSLKVHLAELEIPKEAKEEERHEQTVLECGLNSAKKDLETITMQENKAFDLIEQGIYTLSIFTARMEALTQRKQETTARIESLQARLDELRNSTQTRTALAPKIRYVTELYPLLTSPEDKNNLLKTVISSVIYHRPKGSKPDELSLKIYYLI